MARFGRRDRHRRDALLLLGENALQALDLLLLQIELLLLRRLDVVEALLLDVESLFELNDFVVCGLAVVL